MKKNHIKTLLFYVLLIGIFIAVAATIFRGTTQDKLVLSDVVGYFEDDCVLSFEIDEDYYLTMEIIKVNEQGDKLQNAEGDFLTEEKSYQLQSLALFNEYCGEYVKNNKILNEQGWYEIMPPTTYPWWVSLLPTLFIIILFVVIYFISFKKMGGAGGGKFNSFGKARVKTPAVDESKKVLFRDVAGADEEKEELVEIVEFLKDPAKFTKLGAKIPHGVLLV